MTRIESYDSVWNAIADTPEQAANLRTSAELMRKIAAIVKESGWKQAEAATPLRGNAAAHERFVAGPSIEVLP